MNAIVKLLLKASCVFRIWLLTGAMFEAPWADKDTARIYSTQPHLWVRFSPSIEKGDLSCPVHRVPWAVGQEVIRLGSHISKNSEVLRRGRVRDSEGSRKAISGWLPCSWAPPSLGLDPECVSLSTHPKTPSGPTPVTLPPSLPG